MDVFHFEARLHDAVATTGCWVDRGARRAHRRLATLYAVRLTTLHTAKQITNVTRAALSPGLRHG